MDGAKIETRSRKFQTSSLPHQKAQGHTALYRTRRKMSEILDQLLMEDVCIAHDSTAVT